MIPELPRQNCTGCGACAQRCPKDSITLKANAEGFMYPTVDINKCVHCGICTKICPQLITSTNFKEPVAVFGYAGNSEETKRSTSGGAFYSVACSFIAGGGTVIGAAFTEIDEVEHIIVSNGDELSLLQGSKYVQSNIINVYRDIEKLLKENKRVLFSGTACQIAGLYAYLKNDFENLCTVDVICHGVASPLMFKKHIEWLNNKYSGKVKQYHFRTKSKAGWGNYGRIDLGNGCSKYFSSNDAYIKAFMSGTSYRECCYSCRYAKSKRISDITLGDFWGVQKHYPEIYDKNGVSAIIINTSKGYEVCRAAGVLQKEVAYEKVIQNQHNLKEPTVRPTYRNEIYRGIETLPTDDYIRMRLLPLVTVKDQFHSYIPFSFKYWIKRLKKDF